MSTVIEECLIWSHQHEAWWRPNGRGYTTNPLEAGRYTRAAADAELRWDSHREWLDDGRPHEVVINAPSLAEMTGPVGLLMVRDRVKQATAEAITQRSGGAR